MNVLVVGGAGYIGSAICRLLEERDDVRVVVLDDLSKGHRDALHEDTIFIEGEMSDTALVRGACKRFEIDAAMHFAAWTHVGESVEEPGLYFENNTVGAKRLIDTLMESNVRRFIFSSTAAVYGEPEEIPISEDHPKRPTNPYGWSKLMVEEMLKAYHRAYGLRFAALRYFNACGALAEDLGEDHQPETHLIPVVLQVALGKREEIRVFGTDWPTPDGTCVRDYVHVRDIADAHVRALVWLQEGGEAGAFNLGSGHGHSVREVIDAARQITGHEIPAIEAPRRPGDPARLVASNERAHAELGWVPRHSALDQMIASAWAWHQKHPNGFEDGEEEV